MKTAAQNVEQNLSLLQGQVFAACRMGAWGFDENKGLYISTAPNQEECLAFLRADGALDRAISLRDAEPLPHIMTGSLGLSWIAEWIIHRENQPFLVLLGPVYLKNTSVEQSLRALDRAGIDPQQRRRSLSVLEDVPVVSFDMLRQYACMLHFTAYQEAVNPVAEFPDAPAPQRSAEEADEPGRADGNDFERMAAYEEMLLHHLAEGTPIPGSANRYAGELQDFGLRDALRQVQDNLIIFTALCARTAVRSGAAVYAARTLENEWIRRVEEMRSTAEAYKLLRSQYSAFQRLINQSRDGAGLSRAVRDCRGYIQSNYMNDLTLEAIARHCGYAEYYLSRKFAQETGMKVGEYIHQVRVDAAKIMLVTTSREIQDISDSLRFGNRSHFDRVFRRWVGMSPARFREQGGQAKG